MGDRLLSDPLSAMEQRRRRYRYRTRKEFEFLGPYYGQSLSFMYNEVWNNTEVHWFMETIFPFLSRCTTYNQVFVLLKQVTGNLKKFDRWKNCPRYELFCYLNEFGPLFSGNVSLIRDDTVMWLGTGVERLETSEYYSLFEAALEEIFSHITPSLPYITIEDWVQNPANWATSGATSEKQLWFDSHMHTKWETALRYSPEEILRKVRSNSSTEINRVAVKPEKGKARGIVSSDIWTYIRLSYAMQFIDNGCRNYVYTNLQSDDRRERGWDRWMELSNSGLYSLPLDYSKFDHLPTKREVITIIRRAARWCREHKYFDAESSFLTTASNMESGRVKILIGDEKFNWSNGIASGWRTTSWLDSVINHAWLITAYKYSSHSPAIDLHSDIGIQGDDVATWTATEEEADDIVRILRSFGLDLNPSKFFLSKNRNEYLRLNWTKRYGPIIYGFLTRALSSVFFRKKEQHDLTPDRQEIVNLWLLIRARDFTNRIKWLEHMKRDLYGKLTELTHREIDDWIFTPATLGGAGLGLHGTTGLVSENMTDEKQYIVDRGTMLYRDVTQLSATPYYNRIVFSFLPPDVKNGFKSKPVIRREWFNRVVDTNTCLTLTHRKIRRTKLSVFRDDSDRLNYLYPVLDRMGLQQNGIKTPKFCEKWSRSALRLIDEFKLSTRTIVGCDQFTLARIKANARELSIDSFFMRSLTTEQATRLLLFFESQLPYLRNPKWYDTRT